MSICNTKTKKTDKAKLQ